MNWLYHFFGIGGTGPYYGFWSGIGADFTEIVLIGGAYTLIRKHQCHQGGCWRISRHMVNGSPWCNKHHQAARDNGKVTQ